jgi:hypothetical protein
MKKTIISTPVPEQDIENSFNWQDEHGNVKKPQRIGETHESTFRMSAM